VPAPYPSTVTLTGTPGTHVLFLDLLEVAELRNAHQVVNQAVKHPANPVIPTGRLTEFDSLQAVPWRGTVMWDAEDRIFKAWYMGLAAEDFATMQSRVGYAVSPDGVAWEKPPLGIHEYHGSRANNLVINEPGWMHGPVLKDPAEPDPARRYKLFLAWPAEGLRTIWNAADGVRFRPEPEPCMRWRREADGGWTYLPDPDGVFDVHQVLHDAQDPDPRRRYKCYAQMQQRRGDWRIRKAGLAYGPDPWSWTRSAHNPVLDPDDGEGFQMHYVAVLPWKGYYLMLYEFAWLEPLHGAYVGDVRLAVSRDGEAFRRVQPHQPVMRRGGRGDWDSGFIVTSSDVVVQGDRFWLYYAGASEVWKNWPNENRKGARLGSGNTMPAQTGLATLPLDGFASMESLDGEMPGVITTVPLRGQSPPSALALSVRQTQPGRSWVDVEVVGAGEAARPGYERSACTHVWTDGAALPVRWGARTALPATTDVIRLRFWVYGAARLHGFSFASP